MALVDRVGKEGPEGEWLEEFGLTGIPKGLASEILRLAEGEGG